MAPQFQPSSNQADIPVHQVRCVGCPAVMLRSETRESDGGLPEELPVSRFQIPLYIGKGQGVHFLQPGIFPFIPGWCVPEHLPGLLIIADLVLQHAIIEETAAPEGLCHLHCLVRIRIEAESESPILFSHVFHLLPDSRYIHGSHPQALHPRSADRNSYSRSIPSRAGFGFRGTPSSGAGCWHSYRH